MSEKKRYKWICSSTPSENRHRELAEWYTSQHFHDILNCDGVVGVQAFAISNEQYRDGVDRPYQYVVIWDLESEDIEKDFAQIAWNGENGVTKFTPAFGEWHDIVVSAISKYVTAEEAEGKSVEEVGAISGSAELLAEYFASKQL